MPRDNFAKAQREWENAEPPGWDGVSTVTRECDEEYEKVVVNSLGAEEDVPTTCTFSGIVDVQYKGTTEQWECPECGTVHVTES